MNRALRLISIAIVAAITSLILNSCGSPSDAYLKSRVVKLVSDKGSCSGEQIRAPSGVDYILTAGHCNVLEQADHTITAITEDGRQLRRRVVAEDMNSDLLLLEGIPHMRGLDIASTAQGDQHVRTFTHGAGFSTYKTDGQLIEEKHVQILESFANSGEELGECVGKKHTIVDVPTIFGDVKACLLELDEMASTAFIVPGSSGGLVVNDSGDLVGVVSAGGGGFGYFALLRDIHSFLRNY